MAVCARIVGTGSYLPKRKITNEQIEKMDYVVKRNHVEVFNFLTYKIDLNAKRERELKKNYGKL